MRVYNEYNERSITPEEIEADKKIQKPSKAERRKKELLDNIKEQ
jgi:hypothetical protein